MAATESNSHSRSKRKLLFFFFSIAALYPIVRFLGYSIPKKPQIITIGKTLLPGGFHLEKNFILFDDGRSAWALSRKCTHLGCTIHYHEKEKLLECPCHQSRFSTEGMVLHGPAKRPLDKYKVEKLKDNGGYIVTI